MVQKTLRLKARALGLAICFAGAPAIACSQNVEVPPSKMPALSSAILEREPQNGEVEYSKTDGCDFSCASVAWPATRTEKSDNPKLCITNPYSDVYEVNGTRYLGVMLDAVVRQSGFELLSRDKPAVVFLETGIGSERPVPGFTEGKFCASDQLPGTLTLVSVQSVDSQTLSQKTRGRQNETASVGGVMRRVIGIFGSGSESRVDVMISSTPPGASIVFKGDSKLRTNNSVNVLDTALGDIVIVLGTAKRRLTQCKASVPAIGQLVSNYHCDFSKQNK